MWRQDRGRQTDKADSPRDKADKAGGGSLGTFLERILGHPRGKISNAKYHFTQADKSINLNIYWVEAVERQTVLSPHTTPSNLAGISNFFNILCVFFFRFVIVIDVFLQFPSERPRGGVQLRDWGSSLAAFCGVFPLLHSPLASFSLFVCFCFLSLICFYFRFGFCIFGICAD